MPLLPVLLFFVVYWPALGAWFQRDDFAWLSLSQRIGSGLTLTDALFAPMAQGTVRTISERLFFLVGRWLFDLNAVPFHIAVFLTHIVSLLLAVWLFTRLAGSRWVAVVAASVWTVHVCLYWPLTWVSAYNQVLCAGVLLGSTALFLRYTETGRRGLLAGVWVLFVLGFGVNELNIVFPVLALLIAPRAWRAALWLFVPSVGFYLLHDRWAPKSAVGVYAVALDARLPSTFLEYWGLCIGLSGPLLALVSALLVAGFAGRRDRVIGFGLGWFFVTLGPFLLVPNHVSDYYLFVPLLGLALAFTQLVCSVRYAWVLIVPLVVFQALQSHRLVLQVVAESDQASTFLLGLAEAGRRHPGKTLYVTGVSDVLFWNSFHDRPFYLIGLNRVFLTPDNAAALTPAMEKSDYSDYSQSAGVVVREADNHRAAIFEVRGPRMVNVTAAKADELRRHISVSATIDVASSANAHLLGGQWYEAENNYRWIGQRATVRISAPGQVLTIQGFCVAEQVKGRPFVLTLSTDESVLARHTVSDCAKPIRISAPLPPNQGRFLLGINLDHTVRIGKDARDLGIAIESVTVR